MHDVVQVFLGDVHRPDAGGDLLGQLQTEVIDVGQDDGARAGVTCDGGGHHADGASPGDQHVLAQQVELLRRVHSIAERIEDGTDLIGDVVGQFDDVEGRGHDEFGEGALAVYADALGRGIQMEVTGAGGLGVKVDDMPLGRDALADLQATINVLANGDDLTGELVAGDHRHRDVLLAPVVPVPDVDVGAADGGALDPDQNILVARDRDRGIDQLKADAGPGLGQSLHGGGHQRTPNSRPAVVNAATV